MVGFINLFLSILKAPSLPSATLDVAMLDIAVGHFGHLEVLTDSELAYPFTREVAALAYWAAKKAAPATATSTCPTSPIAPTASRQGPHMADAGFLREVLFFSFPAYRDLSILTYETGSADHGIRL